MKYDYYFAAEDENVLLLVESWTAPELQAAHTKTDKFAALMELKAQYVEDASIDKFTF